tara:strand:- start:241 stop:474 length:234 start_codon:yes stop_codon:yes gene_type:complete
MNQNEKKIVEIISKVLNANHKEINLKSDSNNIKNWDSLANFNILQSIEKNFSIKIKTQDYSKLNSVKEILTLIKKHK